jgi:hypothetical protein
MRGCLVTLILVLLIGVGGLLYWLYLNQGSGGQETLPERASQLIQAPPIEPPARTPESYHILEAQGGIPRAEAERAGLIGETYAYLLGLEPIQLSDGVSPRQQIVVRGKQFDMCYVFETRPPQEQYLEFNLGGQWERLDFGFGFDDGHPSDPEERWAIELEIKGDGKVLLGPRDFKPVDEPLFTTVPLEGVNRLVFVCRRIGYNNPFTPALLDPFASRSAGEQAAQ